MQILESIKIAAAPHDVWTVAGDLGNVADWVPAIASSRLEGDIRHATFEGGGDARERILSVDRHARSYTYEYIDGPLALKSYVSSFAVTNDGTGSTVTWSGDLHAGSPEQEAELAEAISGIYSVALAELSRKVSG